MNNMIISIINNWNPIEIYPLLSDEYHSESTSVTDAVIKSDSIEMLAIEIFNIFKQSFDKEFTKSLEECEVIAEQLLKYKL